MSGVHIQVHFNPHQRKQLSYDTSLCHSA